MKRIFLALFVLIAVFSVHSQNGVITEITGDVELKPASASAFGRASVGSQIAQDTVISTGFRSTAVIAVGSTTLTVRPLTRLTLAEIQSSAGEESLNIDLQTGRVRVAVKPPAGTRANTTVQTPSATASVRGTEGDIMDGNVETDNGSIFVTGKNGLGFMTTGGTSTSMGLDGELKNPFVVTTEGLNPNAPPGSGTSGENLGASGTQAQLVDITIGVDWGD